MIPGLLMLSGAALAGAGFYLARKQFDELGPIKVGDLAQIRSPLLTSEPAEARIRRIDQGPFGATLEVVVERMTDGTPSPDKGRVLHVSPSQVMNVTLEV
jgi:hypothetical protein